MCTFSINQVNLKCLICNSFRKHCRSFFPLLCVLFCDKNRNLSHIIMFLFYYKQTVKQQVEHWGNISPRTRRPGTKDPAKFIWAKTTKSNQKAVEVGWAPSEFTHSTSQVRARVKFESRAKFESGSKFSFFDFFLLFISYGCYFRLHNDVLIANRKNYKCLVCNISLSIVWAITVTIRYRCTKIYRILPWWIF